MDYEQRITVAESSIAALAGLFQSVEKRIAALEAKEPAPAPADERGLYGKYRILKADTGKPVEGDYFVLKLTDRAARAALRTYARVVAKDNPQLSEDILGMVAVHAYTGDDNGDPAPAETVTVSHADLVIQGPAVASVSSYESPDGHTVYRTYLHLDTELPVLNSAQVYLVTVSLLNATQ